MILNMLFPQTQENIPNQHGGPVVSVLSHLVLPAWGRTEWITAHSPSICGVPGRTTPGKVSTRRIEGGYSSSAWASVLAKLEQYTSKQIITFWKLKFNGRTWCGMCPHSVAALVYLPTGQRMRKPRKMLSLGYFFLSSLLSHNTFLPVHNFPQVFPLIN